MNTLELYLRRNQVKNNKNKLINYKKIIYF